jgi:hypothetical protein
MPSKIPMKRKMEDQGEEEDKDGGEKVAQKNAGQQKSGKEKEDQVEEKQVIHLRPSRRISRS